MSGNVERIRGDTRSFEPAEFPKEDGDVAKVRADNPTVPTHMDKKERMDSGLPPVTSEEERKPGTFPFMEETKEEGEKKTVDPAETELLKLEDAYINARFFVEQKKEKLREEMTHGTSGPVLQRLEDQVLEAEKEMKRARKRVRDQLRKIIAEGHGQ